MKRFLHRQHRYTSTACYHAQHGDDVPHTRCRRTCKFCGVQCQCTCHSTVPAVLGSIVPDVLVRSVEPFANSKVAMAKAWDEGWQAGVLRVAHHHDGVSREDNPYLDFKNQTTREA